MIFSLVRHDQTNVMLMTVIHVGQGSQDVTELPTSAKRFDTQIKLNFSIPPNFQSWGRPILGT